MKKNAVDASLTIEEKALLSAIVKNKYEGGNNYPRAAWVEIICPDRKGKAVLRGLCEKGLAETGMGGTVAGDFYTACWLTGEGEAVYRGLERETAD
ncbi:MAG: hypothetical protein EPN93_18770 [Spirochaetes bacterium]|nr:MAG: hypothetical protein EPN93_18770 [Spirochaetota bacterium]